MANWYGNASPDLRRAINQAFYGSGRTATIRRCEVYRSDKYIYYSDGSRERW